MQSTNQKGHCKFIYLQICSVKKYCIFTSYHPSYKITSNKKRKRDNEIQNLSSMESSTIVSSSNGHNRIRITLVVLWLLSVQTLSAFYSCLQLYRSSSYAFRDRFTYLDKMVSSWTDYQIHIYRVLSTSIEQG